MAMFIVKPWYRKSGFNPNDYFDPVTHIATEANFIRLLQDGIYDSSLIGYKVRLENSVDYNNGLWVIADVNHDSENTGQTDCYDLISEDIFHNVTFGNSSQKWRSSTIRSWLNATFIGGFNSIYEHLINPKYNSQGTWYTNDTIIIPSYKEVNGGSSSSQDNEGVAYPIFTDNASRIKYQSGTSTVGSWWTRSCYTSNSNHVWIVNAGGHIIHNNYYNSNYLAPILRVQ